MKFLLWSVRIYYLPKVEAHYYQHEKILLRKHKEIVTTSNKPKNKKHSNINNQQQRTNFIYRKA